MASGFPALVQDALSVEDAFDHLIEFTQRFGSGAARLAAYCSVTDRLTAESVGLLRQNFLGGEDRWQPALDAFVLYGGVCSEVGGGFFVMDKELRRQFLFSLDIWALKRGESEVPSKSAGLFFRHYARHLRRTSAKQGTYAFREYLTAMEWEALGFADPHLAAQLLAHCLKAELDREEAGLRVRLDALTGTLSLPLSEFGELIALAEGIEAARQGDIATARRLFGPAAAPQLTVGDVSFPAPHELHARFSDLPGARGQTLAAPATPSLKPAINPEPTGLARKRTPAEGMRIFQVHDAVRANDLSAFRLALAGQPDSVDQFDELGDTPLHLAARLGRNDMLAILVEGGADVDRWNDEGTTPLYEAAGYGNVVTVTELLRLGADPNRRGRVRGSTPLMQAAWHGHAEVIRALCSGGADVGMENREHSGPLHCAAGSGRVQVFQLLRELGAKLERNPKAPLLRAAAFAGSLTLLTEIAGIEEDPDPVGNDEWRPLHIASLFGHAGFVTSLLELGADPDRPILGGWTPLLLAA
ncbi:MAG: ankyrin repeat domain-containing protein, partial [Limnohabitans sp.]|nr:ankyrin repeat domain-containing protein [Limnohabitans sp.]